LSCMRSPIHSMEGVVYLTMVLYALPKLQGALESQA
jgi:hypothetical protein